MDVKSLSTTDNSRKYAYDYIVLSANYKITF